MRKTIYLFTLLCLCSGIAFAQTKSASGTVTSAEDGEPIAGASVAVKGTTYGTITDTNGKFTLSDLPASAATITISFIGLETVETGIGENLNIVMKESSLSLDEVIVVAYGTTTKKAFTGSAAVIKSEEIGKNQSSNVTNNIAGKVAGVQGLSSNGQPGQGSTLRIRGVGSMSSSNAPLYVVDGVPYGTNISAINNNDIESITILKDAASAALYGARGANGVVLITTKRGKTKEARINMDARWGNNSRGVPQYRVMKDPAMYYETFYRALYNSRINASANPDAAHAYADRYLLDASNGGLDYQVYGLPKGERLVGTNFKLNPGAKLGYNDGNFTYLPDNWYDEIFHANNLRQEYNVDASGAIDNIIYRTSFGYLGDSGIIPSSDLKRFSSQTNIEYKLKDYLKVGVNINYANIDMNNPGEQTNDDATSSVNLFYLTSSIAPIYPLYLRDANGKIMIDRNGHTMYDYGDGTVAPVKRPFMGQSNPLSALQLNIEKFNIDNFFGSWFAEVEAYENLKLKATLGYQTYNMKYNQLTNNYYGQYASSGGYVSVQMQRITGLNQQYLATYVNTFNQHSIDLLAGFESFKLRESALSGSKQKIFQPNVPELGNAITDPYTNSLTETYATMGFLAQAKYSYRAKYYGSASFRRDASSSFHPDNRWGNFWSVGGAWDMRGEDFMSDFDRIDLLKIKASYGVQGNDKLLYPGSSSVNLYPYQDQFKISENNGSFATARSYKGNKDITWETSYNFNAGVEFSFFDDRLNGSVEGFSRETKDQLYYRPVSPSLGYSLFPMNIGSVRNAGFEVDLHGDAVRTNDLVVNLYFNTTYIKNTIVALHESLNGQWISGSYIYREGSSLYNFYVREYAGVNPENGESLWYVDEKDDNGNVTGRTTTNNWSTATQYEQGDIMPKFYGGFGAEVEFKGFDLGLSFNYQLGGKIYDNGYSSLMHSGYSSDAGNNWHQDILDMWTEENKNTNVPRVSSGDTYTNAVSSRFLRCSNYLSLQNVTIGYTLPTRFVNRFKIEKLRIYGVADNVALLSSRTGLDPRQSYTTSTPATYSALRSVSGGISVTF
ncbi:MAG: TonB-dependent receptor [Tannerella sp.]|jgi:TonB-linked SusC/RagA family outer membrane protein|nr:TonB-dependent receptor [Tannerella sp.]